MPGESKIASQEGYSTIASCPLYRHRPGLRSHIQNKVQGCVTPIGGIRRAGITLPLDKVPLTQALTMTHHEVAADKIGVVAGHPRATERRLHVEPLEDAPQCHALLLTVSANGIPLSDSLRRKAVL